MYGGTSSYAKAAPPTYATSVAPTTYAPTAVSRPPSLPSLSAASTGYSQIAAQQPISYKVSSPAVQQPSAQMITRPAFPDQVFNAQNPGKHKLIGGAPPVQEAAPVFIAPAAPVFIAPPPALLQSSSQKQQEIREQLAPEKKRKPICKKLCKIFCLVLLASVLIAGFVNLYKWSSVRVPQTLAEMKSRSCHIASKQSVTIDQQNHKSYIFPVADIVPKSNRSVTIPANFNAGGRLWQLPTIDLNWMAVTCWVSLTESLEADFQRADGQVPLTIFQPQNMMRFDLPPLRCSEEVARLADQDDGFDCSYAQTDSEHFGVIAASKEELSHNSFALGLWKYSRTGFPFAVFAVCAAFSAFYVILVFVAKVCCWKKCTCRCWTSSIVSVSFLLTVLGIMWVAYQSNQKSQALTNLKGGTCELRSSDYRDDPQEHPNYKVAGSQLTLPGSISLRGYTWKAPVVSADWAMVTCWVDLKFPSDFGAVPHSSDGKVPLTWVDREKHFITTPTLRPLSFLPSGDPLHCSSVVKMLASAKSIDCSYAEGAFDGFGVLAMSKEIVPTTFPKVFILELIAATRTGFPFVLCLVATCVTVLFSLFKALQACGRCVRRKCRRAAAREGNFPDIHEPLLGK